MDPKELNKNPSEPEEDRNVQDSKKASVTSATNSNKEMRFHFNANKAGMEEMVQKNINEVVEKALKGTAYYKRQVEKQEANAKKIEFYKAKLTSVHSDPKLLARVTTQFESRIKDLKKDLDLSRQWIHIDLDMFFVAIELRDNPQYKDKPVGVGRESLIQVTAF